MPQRKNRVITKVICLTKESRERMNARLASTDERTIERTNAPISC